jgi:hypothetical protein
MTNRRLILACKPPGGGRHVIYAHRDCVRRATAWLCEVAREVAPCRCLRLIATPRSPPRRWRVTVLVLDSLAVRADAKVESGSDLPLPPRAVGGFSA